MPELPEVETYVRELESQIKGRRVVAAFVTWPRTIAFPSAVEFEKNIINARFTSFGRRGKYMLLGLDDGRTLIVHLRMTGKFHLLPPTSEPDKHVHVQLTLDNDEQLHFQDTRKFGRLWLTDEPDSVVQKLGPEPLGNEFSVEYLAEALASRKASIKSLLLNQSIVAGIGNIYADESLHHAHVHPARAGGNLTPAEIARLHSAIIQLLSDAIELQGSTLGTSQLQHYSRPGGQRGSFQEKFKVFRRTGDACYACGTPIERIVVAQRSTHFCPHCQPSHKVSHHITPRQS